MLKIPNTKTVDCRYGKFTVLNEDEFVGKALVSYGEYSEDEVNMMKEILRPGDVAIDCGANIGAFTIPMAQLVGPTGKVYAFEPGHNNIDILKRNLEQNGITWTKVYNCGASDKEGKVRVAPVASLNLWRRPEAKYNDVTLGPAVYARVRTIDSLNLPKLKFIKIDVDGMEIEIIEGMDKTIRRCRPFIYIENEQEGKQQKLIASLTRRAYRLYWHIPPQFNPNNYRGNKFNWFGRICSVMMIAVPEEFGPIVDNLDEIADLREDPDMFNREIARYKRYLKYDNNDLQARLMLAHNLNLMQRTEEAQAMIEENLRIKPDHIPTNAIKGLLALQRFDFKAGWPAFELRFKQKNLRMFGGHRKFDVPKWDGQPTDKKLLIWSEQGFGDMMMFIRFAPEILKRAPNAVFECHSSLQELFLYSKIIPPEKLYILHRTPPEFDLHCSLPSTAVVMDATPEMIQQYAPPYLFADQALADEWIDRGSPSFGGHQTLGMCHRGSHRSERPMTRDIDPRCLRPIVDLTGPMFALQQQGQFDNWMDCAAALKTLELVISVDTGVAHLAGAMGLPVWLLLAWDPDWRWGLKGDTTIWYPTMRIFRQHKFLDWTETVEDLRQALIEFKVTQEKQQAA